MENEKAAQTVFDDEAPASSSSRWRNVMLDIETMSTHPTRALVLSVAVLAFDVAAPEVVMGPRQMWVLDPSRQLLDGREVSADTQAWWGRQPAEASSHWATTMPRCSVDLMASELNDFWCDYVDPIEGKLWANGVVFDVGNLEDLVRGATGEAPPWPYHSVRDYRTVVMTLPQVEPRVSPDFGAQHNPMVDCLSQAWWLHGVLSSNSLKL